jgi:hypothetical protein
LKILAKLIFECLRFIFRSKQDIALENLALRQQLAVQQRSIKRPKIKNSDRIFWIWMARFWNNWRSSLIVVSRETWLYWPVGWSVKGNLSERVFLFETFIVLSPKNSDLFDR